jgi:hypothetical protein
MTYRVCSIFGAPEVNHTINASEGRAAALAAVGVEFFLGEDIAAALVERTIVSI